MMVCCDCTDNSCESMLMVCNRLWYLLYPSVEWHSLSMQRSVAFLQWGRLVVPPPVDHSIPSSVQSYLNQRRWNIWGRIPLPVYTAWLHTIGISSQLPSVWMPWSVCSQSMVGSTPCCLINRWCHSTDIQPGMEWTRQVLNPMLGRMTSPVRYCRHTIIGRMCLPECHHRLRPLHKPPLPRAFNRSIPEPVLGNIDLNVQMHEVLVSSTPSHTFIRHEQRFNSHPPRTGHDRRSQCSSHHGWWYL